MWLSINVKKNNKRKWRLDETTIKPDNLSIKLPALLEMNWELDCTYLPNRYYCKLHVFHVSFIYGCVSDNTK